MGLIQYQSQSQQQSPVQKKNLATSNCRQYIISAKSTTKSQSTICQSLMQGSKKKYLNFNQSQQSEFSYPKAALAAYNSQSQEPNDAQKKYAENKEKGYQPNSSKNFNRFYCNFYNNINENQSFNDNNIVVTKILAFDQAKASVINSSSTHKSNEGRINQSFKCLQGEQRKAPFQLQEVNGNNQIYKEVFSEKTEEKHDINQINQKQLHIQLISCENQKGLSEDISRIQEKNNFNCSYNPLMMHESEQRGLSLGQYQLIYGKCDSSSSPYNNNSHINVANGKIDSKVGGKEGIEKETERKCSLEETENKRTQFSEQQNFPANYPESYSNNNIYSNKGQNNYCNGNGGQLQNNQPYSSNLQPGQKLQGSNNKSKFSITGGGISELNLPSKKGFKENYYKLIREVLEDVVFDTIRKGDFYYQQSMKNIQMRNSQISKYIENYRDTCNQHLQLQKTQLNQPQNNFIDHISMEIGVSVTQTSKYNNNQKENQFTGNGGNSSSIYKEKVKEDKEISRKEFGSGFNCNIKNVQNLSLIHI
eukprot:TRINITY_DN16332_c0_g1_i1.p1 TRINITY_DN16332_c0_g1~~TRINITY_DN16332_c0_g1_i1.p1  ORF type:complete len:534 (-),score=84.37 TRINITY_DN16332_c0_g1_i1:142-1743(-)